MFSDNFRPLFIDYYRMSLGNGECPRETVGTLSGFYYERVSTLARGVSFYPLSIIEIE